MKKAQIIYILRGKIGEFKGGAVEQHCPLSPSLCLNVCVCCMQWTLPHSFPVCLAQLLASVSSYCTVLSLLCARFSSLFAFQHPFLSFSLSFPASVTGGSVAVQHLSDGNGINWKPGQLEGEGVTERGRESVIKRSVQGTGQIQHVQVQMDQLRKIEEYC